MAWGRQTKSQAPPSTLSAILPLLITFTVLGALAWVGFQIYLSVMKIQAQAKKQMGDKNVVFTKDGVRVGVHHVETEDYLDKTQSWVVKAWNLGSTSKGGEKKKR
ncbi:hypothetical protein B0H63DRAFT_522133 [Podospora didyma]|uniref:Uncharacterized protein n=1 Tax=Podospora didyma TaxID=330526 RepID=A0AAE0TYY7_9PEZI|nr:hypothetical protein B0H63DRAFT_522133 [Podospora didyma]